MRRSTLTKTVLLLLFSVITVNGQTQSTTSVTDGMTPAGLTPGSPAGTYALSDFDNINLFNGNLNFRLPFLSVGGRGDIGYSMTLALNLKGWRVKHFHKIMPDENEIHSYKPNQAGWLPYGGYGVGQLSGRHYGIQVSTIFGGQPYYSTTLGRLTFSTADGTEYELRDQLTDGKPLHSTFSQGAYRGTVFVTADGSSATYISDIPLYDNPDFNSNGPRLFSASELYGYLMLRDGTCLRIEGGNVAWMRDRNGNKISFTYDTNGALVTVTDSLNRQVNIAYNFSDVAPYGLCDRITFKGFGGAERIIRISKTNLENALRPGSGYTIKFQGGPGGLFPELNGAFTTITHNPQVASAVWLPDGLRAYKFYYNSYGELARVEVPTGGAVEYDMTPGSGVVCGFGPCGSPEDERQIYRRVIERRVYPDGSTGSSFEHKSVYVNTETIGGNTSTITVEQLSPSGTVLSRSRHLFEGGALDSLFGGVGITHGYGAWNEGKEKQTEALDTVGTIATATVLRRIVYTWAQRTAVPWLAEWQATHGGADEPSKDPRLIETVTTIEPATQNLVTKTTAVNAQTGAVGYDQYNNPTDSCEFDYGTGSPGALARWRHTEYLTTNAINGADYTSTSIHIRNLPTLMSIYDAGLIERARATSEYDNYASDTNHAALINRASISGLHSSFTTSYTTRGNVTGRNNHFLVGGSVTGSISSFIQFDIAGNAVKAIDARGNPTNFDFSDRFGAPNGEARANSSPSELNTVSQFSFAFPTLVTNALGQTRYSQFDYYLGRAVDAEDANGVTYSSYFNDPLDRAKQFIRGANQGTGIKSQSTFNYDDTTRIVTTTSDHINYQDNVIKNQTVYDGFARIVELRQYETATTYITIKKAFDALGRNHKISNPFRSGEAILWTTTSYDALSREILSSTPDSAVINTSYIGNTVTTTDQNGKSRKKVSDALGRLTQVYEDPNGLNFLTSYTYDVLDNLTNVNQGSQSRVFAYDSLKRLVSTTNPESGTVNFQYDNNGSLLVKTEARGVSAHYEYDVLNRLTRSWFNGSSLVTSIIHNTPALPSGVGASDEVKYFYDSQSLPGGAPTFSRGFSTGRLVAITYGGISAGDYFGTDALGRQSLKIQQTGSVNYQTSAVYNLASAITSQTYPSGRIVTNTYDDAGRTSSVTGTLGDGASRTYSTGIIYSSLGWMTKEQFGTTTPIFNKHFYNSRGQLSEIRESTSYTGPTDTTWDRGAIINHFSNQCWGMCGGSNSTTSMTDNNGNLKKQEVYIPNSDSFAQFYEYDSLNRLQSVRENKNGGAINWQQAYGYDRYGNRWIDQTNTWGTSIPKPNFGVDTATNRLTAPAGFTMSYDAVGNLTNDTFTGQGGRTYDAQSRIKQAWASSQWQTYSYDGEGHRVKRNVNGTETWQVYGLDGELLAEYSQNGSAASPQKEYGYRNGHLLITTSGTSGWGPPPTLSENPLVVGETTVKAIHIAELRAAINALRSNLSMSAYSWQFSATTNDYISANPVLEMRTALDQAIGPPAGGYSSGLAQGQIIKASHIQELRDRVLASWNTSGGFTVRWLVLDQLGTPRMIFDQSGASTSVSRHDYLPFGEEIGANVGGRTTAQGYSQSDGVRQRFTGAERDDETGLDFLQARYYASSQGRFTSPDDYQGQVSDPQTLNLYAYVHNNPLNFVDPTGHMAEGAQDQQQPPQQPLPPPPPPPTLKQKEQEPPQKVGDVVVIKTIDPEIKGVKVKQIDKVDGGPEVPIGGQFEITYTFVINEPTDGSNPADAGKIEPISRTGTFTDTNNLGAVGDPKVTVDKQKEGVKVEKTERFEVKGLPKAIDPRDTNKPNRTSGINFKIVVVDPNTGRRVEKKSSPESRTTISVRNVPKEQKKK